MVLRARSTDRRYQIGRQIATGSHSEIYAGYDAEQGRSIAIKRLKIHAASTPAAERARFLCEAVVLATLDHPNVVELVDLGEVGGSIYLVTEFIDGPSLSQWLEYRRQASSPMPVEVVCGIVGQIARGLSHVHERSLPDGSPLLIAHRDLCPENVLFSNDGVPKLIDFGLASLVGHETSVETETRRTLLYSSPELAREQDTAPCSDVFSAGALMFEMLSGRPLYEEHDPMPLSDRLRLGAFGSIRERLSGFDEELIAIVEDATRVDPLERIVSARELERRLDRFRAGRGLRIDAEMLKKAIEEVQAGLTISNAEELGELSDGELVFPAGPPDTRLERPPSLPVPKQSFVPPASSGFLKDAAHNVTPLVWTFVAGLVVLLIAFLFFGFVLR